MRFRHTGPVFWTAAAVLTVAGAGIVLRNSDERGRRRAWVMALALSTGGVAAVGGAVLTGNIGLAYGGSLAALMGVLLLVVVGLLLYRDLRDDPRP